MGYGGGASLRDDYNRVFNTHFNGAANVALAGGLATLQNMPVVMQVIEYYQENTRLIMETFKELGFTGIYGGRNSPYVFVEIPEKAQVITTPGVGFGPAGEGFVRVSSYGSHENVREACRRFKACGLGK